jgi:hypothetical protein
MTTEKFARSRRRGKLNAGGRRLRGGTGGSCTDSGSWPESPESVPIDIAPRAAGRACRGGVTHGAYFMPWNLRGDAREAVR